MRINSFINILALVLASHLLAGCNKQPIPVELAFGLKSHSPIKTVEAEVMSAKGKWNVIENNSLPPSDKRPRFEYIRIETDAFDAAGSKGRTLLTFYNGKLMSVWFYANDWGAYKKHLEATLSISIKNNAWEKTSGNVRTWIATDHLKNTYIGWEDVTLTNTMQKWIEKYS